VVFSIAIAMVAHSRSVNGYILSATRRVVGVTRCPAQSLAMQRLEQVPRRQIGTPWASRTGPIGGGHFFPRRLIFSIVQFRNQMWCTRSTPPHHHGFGKAAVENGPHRLRLAVHPSWVFTNTIISYRRPIDENFPGQAAEDMWSFHRSNWRLCRSMFLPGVYYEKPFSEESSTEPGAAGF